MKYLFLILVQFYLGKNISDQRHEENILVDFVPPVSTGNVPWRQDRDRYLTVLFQPDDIWVRMIDFTEPEDTQLDYEAPYYQDKLDLDGMDTYAEQTRCRYILYKIL